MVINMKKYIVKARSDTLYRRSSGMIIFIVAAFVCFAAFMAVYTLSGSSEKRLAFGIGYIASAVLGLMYVIIRINTVYATYIAADDENVYMKNWVNDFLPYNTGGGIKFVNAFIPARTKLTEVPIEDIYAVFIGTKNFIKRYARTNDDFLKSVRIFEHSKDRYEKKQVQGMDIFYIETIHGESCYMPIVKFNTKAVNKLLKTINRKNPAAEIKSGSRIYKAFKKDNTESAEL